MIVIKNAVYVRNPKGYAKCVLHKKEINGRPVYSLAETKVIINELPKEYAVMTLPEIIAKYGVDAVDDDAVESPKEE